MATLMPVEHVQSLRNTAHISQGANTSQEYKNDRAQRERDKEEVDESDKATNKSTRIKTPERTRQVRDNEGERNKGDTTVAPRNKQRLRLLDAAQTAATPHN